MCELSPALRSLVVALNASTALPWLFPLRVTVHNHNFKTNNGLQEKLAPIKKK